MSDTSLTVIVILGVLGGLTLGVCGDAVGAAVARLKKRRDSTDEDG